MVAAISILNYYPVSGIYNVNVAPYITFSSGVKSNCLYFSLSDNIDSYGFTTTYASGTLIATFTPSGNFSFNKTITATFASGLDNANVAVPSKNWTFITPEFHQFASWGWPNN